MGIIPPQSIRICPICNCKRQFKYNPNTRHSHCETCGVISLLATKPQEYRHPKAFCNDIFEPSIAKKILNDVLKEINCSNNTIDKKSLFTAIKGCNLFKMSNYNFKTKYLNAN